MTTPAGREGGFRYDDSAHLWRDGRGAVVLLWELPCAPDEELGPVIASPELCSYRVACDTCGFEMGRHRGCGAALPVPTRIGPKGCGLEAGQCAHGTASILIGLRGAGCARWGGAAGAKLEPSGAE